ncbi:MAG TPA: MarC family protein [Methanomassiliicoccales archaeon]|nr:MarC family protein [Methanomassiliicoccales archaeon]
MDPAFIATVFGTLFAIINPIGNVPIFEAVTDGFDEKTKRMIAKKAMVYTAAVLIGFGLFGNYIFDLFGITIPAFKVMGGLLIFYLGFNMVEGQGTTHKVTEDHTEDAVSLAIVPLTIPLYGGPGSIATTMVLVSQADGAMDLTMVFVAILCILIISYVLIMKSEVIFRRLGKSGSIAFTRIMGVLLAGMGISFIISGAIEAVQQSGLV